MQNCNLTEEQLVQKRLHVLKFATKSGNVSKACRIYKMDRTSFYKWKKRYELYGNDGLKNKVTTQIKSEAIEQIIVNTVLEHPNWGLQLLSRQLSNRGISISAPTISKILLKSGLHSKYDRISWLVKQVLNQGYQLNNNQKEFINKLNPCFFNREISPPFPGTVLVQDFFPITYDYGRYNLCVEVVIDTNNLFSFCSVVAFENSNRPDIAIHVLDKKVLPFYRELNLTVKTIITSKYSKYCYCRNSANMNNVNDPIFHPFEKYLLYKGITHERSFQTRRISRNGFVKQFCTQIRKEFLPTTRDSDNLHDLQNRLEEWLLYYNYKKSLFGFPNFGQPPYEIIRKSQLLSSLTNKNLNVSLQQFMIALYYDIKANEYFIKFKHKNVAVIKIEQTFHFKNNKDREKVKKFKELNKENISFHNLGKKAEALILREGGLHHREVAYKIGVNDATVRRWEKRYIEFGIEGLYDKRYSRTLQPY